MAKKVSIIVGSVLGATEYVAEAAEGCLQQKGYEVSVFLQPKLEDIPKDSIWLVCTSTHGAGDLPDNIVSFAKQVEQANLDKLEVYIIGLGDSSYDTFCYGAATMERLLTNAGGVLCQPTHTIDVLQHPIPEDDAVNWLQEHF